jgi:hypothetical protein
MGGGRDLGIHLEEIREIQGMKYVTSYIFAI